MAAADASETGGRRSARAMMFLLPRLLVLRVFSLYSLLGRVTEMLVLAVLPA
jgi:hypothetical protein